MVNRSAVVRGYTVAFAFEFFALKAAHFSFGFTDSIEIKRKLHCEKKEKIS